MSFMLQDSGEAVTSQALTEVSDRDYHATPLCLPRDI